MATIYWEGKADAVAQVHTGSIDSVDATPSNNDFTVTIGGVAVTVTGDTDVATTATALRTALNASTHPYFSAITWSGTGGDIIGTADTAGVPFVAALTETGAGSATVTDFAETTANAGPNVWSTAGNWSGGAVPTGSDDVIIENSSVPILWLPSSAQSLNSLTIRKSFTGVIGLKTDTFATSATGEDTSKPEYRTDYLKVSTAQCDIGEHFGTNSVVGSGRLKIDFGSATACQITVHDSKTSATETSLQPIRILASNASTDLYVRKGIVGVATNDPAETSTLGDINVSYIDGQTSDSSVFIGVGVTLTNLITTGGTTITESAPTTISCDAGEVLIAADGTITNLNISGDVTSSGSQATITNCSLFSGGIYTTDFNRVTHSNGIDLQRCGIEDVTLRVGSHVTLTPSAI